MDEQQITTRMAEPVHLTISRSAKGKIQYEISIHAATVDDTAWQVFELENRVKAQYKGQLAGEVEE